MKKVAIIGYSGHAYVACDLIRQSGRELLGYCDKEEKSLNPFSLSFLGDEMTQETLRKLEGSEVFVAIGDNFIRRKVAGHIRKNGLPAITLVHPSAHISPYAQIGSGSMVNAGAMINALALIGEGAVLNTGCIIEHECRIGNYAHIAPGAVLAGNVQVGEAAFIGANAVVKQGVTIGAEAIIGAGTVVIRDVPAGSTMVGNPQKSIGA